MKKVLIIILNYLSWKDTLQEIKHLKKILEYDNYQIMVIDNCSPNDSHDILSKFSMEYNYIYVQSGKNKGYAAGNNIGLRYAYENKYDFAWILNNDIVIESPRLLKNMIQIFEKDSTLAIVNPEILSLDGYVFNRDSVRPSFFDMTLGMFNYRKKGRKIVDIGSYAYVYRPQGCCMLLDINKIREVDYLDEKTFLYYEECIVAERLLKKHYKCALCINEKIIHNHSKTVRSVIKNSKIRRIKRISFEYYLKEYREFDPIQRIICIFFENVKNLMLE